MENTICRVTLEFRDVNKSSIEWIVRTNNVLTLSIKVTDDVGRNVPITLFLKNESTAVIPSSVYDGGVFYFEEIKE